MCKRNIEKIKYFFILGTILIPSFVKAWTPGEPIVPDCARAGNDVVCGFSGLLELVSNVLDVFIWIAAPIATIIFAWIGWTFIVDSDKSSARSEAKKRFMSLVKGVFFILAAWVIIDLIVNSLIDPSFNLPDL